MKKNPVWLIIISVCLFSCTDQYDICDTPRTVQLNGGFYHRSAGTESTISPAAFTLYLLSTTVKLYDQQAGLTKWNLQLNPLTDTAKYFVNINNNPGGDTITFIYNSQRVTLPEPCGYINTNTLMSVSSTRNKVDTVKISNTAVGTAGTENIKLYY
jgi:hypothetical protein